jgi:hypothetical protein
MTCVWTDILGRRKAGERSKWAAEIRGEPCSNQAVNLRMITEAPDTDTLPGLMAQGVRALNRKC